tara:strand:- start:388 stop:846 length:459 start_codon:yes stop_codon:yes gene_type:complete
MVAFYFISIVCLGIHLTYQVYTGSIQDVLRTPVGGLNAFVSALFFAPWFETLLYNVFLTKVFSYIKCRPLTIIFAVAVIFSASHYTQGIFAPLLIFVPAVAFSWNYYLYYEKGEPGWGFLSTMVLHFLYNFTLFVVIPMIYMVIDMYYIIGD